MADRLGRSQQVDGWLDELSTRGEAGRFGEDQAARAAILAWRGEKERATELFRLAMAEGYPLIWPRQHPRVDPIWQPLRDHAPFLELIAPRG